MRNDYTIGILQKRLIWETSELAKWEKEKGSYANHQVFAFKQHIAAIERAINLLEVDQMI